MLKAMGTTEDRSDGRSGPIGRGDPVGTFARLWVGDGVPGAGAPALSGQAVAGGERIHIEVEKGSGRVRPHRLLEQSALADSGQRGQRAQRDDVRHALAAELDGAAAERQRVRAIVAFGQIGAQPRVRDHESTRLQQAPGGLDREPVQQHQAVERRCQRVINFAVGDHEVGVAVTAARSRLVRLRLGDPLARRGQRLGEHFGAKNQPLAAGAANADFKPGIAHQMLPSLVRAPDFAAVLARWAAAALR